MARPPHARQRWNGNSQLPSSPACGWHDMGMRNQPRCILRNQLDRWRRRPSDQPRCNNHEIGHELDYIPSGTRRWRRHSVYYQPSLRTHCDGHEPFNAPPHQQQRIRRRRLDQGLGLEQQLEIKTLNLGVFFVEMYELSSFVQKQLRERFKRFVPQF